jgi:hypothetical protein
MTFNLSNDILFKTFGKYSLAKSQRRDHVVVELICDLASLREPHFLDYSEASVMIRAF